MKKQRKYELFNDYSYLEKLDAVAIDNREKDLRKFQRELNHDLYRLSCKLTLKILLISFLGFNILNIIAILIHPEILAFIKSLDSTLPFFLETMELGFSFIFGKMITDDDNLASKISSKYSIVYDQYNKVIEEILKLSHTRDRCKYKSFFHTEVTNDNDEELVSYDEFDREIPTDSQKANGKIRVKQIGGNYGTNKR